MKKLFVFMACAAMSVMAFAQQGGPSAPVVSPEINPDNTVTFRYKNPKAVKVVLEGEMLGDVNKVDMVEGADGVWSYTTAPLEGELYRYNFRVDGEFRADPANVYIARDVAAFTNYFVLSTKEGDKGWYYQTHDTPHGTVSKRWYQSPTLGLYRRVTVYTPAGYETSNKKYPVLYLLHGSGGDEDAWNDLGRTIWILDNLIAEGKAEPMLVVMPNGVYFNSAAPGYAVNNFQPNMMNSRSQSTVEIENSFKDVINFVESNYKVKKDYKSRAVAGLSMGGRQSCAVSRANPGTFGYVGMFSGTVAADTPEQEAALALQMDKKWAPKLYWIFCGCDDSRGILEGSRNLNKYCEDKGYPVDYFESTGAHEWRNWRIYLTMFCEKIFK